MGAQNHRRTGMRRERTDHPAFYCSSSRPRLVQYKLQFLAFLMSSTISVFNTIDSILIFSMRPLFIITFLFGVALTNAFRTSPANKVAHKFIMANSGRDNNEALNVRINPIKTCAAIVLSFMMTTQLAFGRPEGVNRPDLLPKEQTPLIDVANFLSKGQEKKAINSIQDLEKSTGYKLRILCQSYPETPGLAIKEYWGVDDNTVVMVVDRGEGFNRKGIPTNILNLNIGKNVELVLPSQFWSRLGNKLGNQPYVKANGEDVAVLNAIEAITYCLKDKDCVDIPFNI